MHGVARRAGLWRRTHGIARRCTSFSSSSNGSLNEDTYKQKQTKPGWDSSQAVVADKDKVDIRRQPPLQSLHKAILAGKITLPPFQKVRKNGKVATIFNVATGGMWRLPISSKLAAAEDECTDPCLQYHKVVIHDEGLGKLAVRTLRRGMQVYVEGELETRVFNDTETGSVKRDREVAVHATGQVMAWTEKGPVSLEYC
ncbi:hypothetical protein GOP47_0009919 [Adiantum capillus-veneris]|uniref:Single-stranded DNA-binding protein n=1 Tax=Adiantum capillus-veneris TaxID=13818 RepID=A0A9D4UYC9_ADICA|nr:hypothetical protein GOP47_0009919 [Adiantum capillus-veneris]